MTLDERLARLERANRRLWAACGAMGLACLLGATGQRVPEVVTARSFQVVDERGELVASLGNKDLRTYLQLHDREGRSRATLYVDGDGSPMLSLRGDDADPTRTAALLYVDSKYGPGLQLRKDGVKKVLKTTDP
jgi:hypothetical protein